MVSADVLPGGITRANYWHIPRSIVQKVRNVLPPFLDLSLMNSCADMIVGRFEYYRTSISSLFITKLVGLPRLESSMQCLMLMLSATKEKVLEWSTVGNKAEWCLNKKNGTG